MYYSQPVRFAVNTGWAPTPRETNVQGLEPGWNQAGPLELELWHEKDGQGKQPEMRRQASLLPGAGRPHRGVTPELLKEPSLE